MQDRKMREQIHMVRGVEKRNNILSMMLLYYYIRLQCIDYFVIAVHIRIQLSN